MGSPCSLSHVEGQAFVVTFLVAGVTRPILSVALLGLRGWEAVLGDGYGYVQRKGDTTLRAELVGRGGLYYLRSKVDGNAIMNMEEVTGENEEKGEKDDEEPCVEDDVAEGTVANDMEEPGAPTEAGRRQHDITHIPVRAWCPKCVQGRGRYGA